MSKKVLFIKEEHTIWTFLLEDEEIVEIHCDHEQSDGSSPHQLGNIYIGRVKKVITNIGAAFVEIEPGVECYYDLSQAKTALFTKKCGKKELCIGDELVVQISKEAVKTKAITVTSNVSFTGHYAVLTSGNTRMGVSTKLPKKRREAYKEWLSAYDNEEFGLIIRTNAKDADFAAIQREIETHIEDYHQFKQRVQTRTCFSCLQSALPAYLSNLNNIYMEGLTEIIVDDPDMYQSIQSYVQLSQPQYLDKIRLHQAGVLTLPQLYETRKAVKQALSEKVWIKNGAYLVIQPTEALTVIDVNSGKFDKKGSSSDSWLKINREAAKEIAKQIRLRNISGIVIVDFINMDNPEDNATLLKELKVLLGKDPIQTTLVGMTALHLVEITRKKIRKPLRESIDGYSSPCS